MKTFYTKSRYFFRLLGAYIKRFKVLIFLSTLFGIIVFLFVNTFIMPSLQKQVIKVGITGRFTAENLPKSIAEKLSSGLTQVDESGIPKPKIAKAWSYDDSGKTWLFELDSNVKWHNGEELTSEDINYNFTDIEIVKPDSHTIIFKLNNKYAPLPSILSKPILKNGYLGVGEWKVKSLILNGTYIQELTLSKNNTSEIVYKFFPTDERTKLAYKLGEISRIEGMLDPSPFNNWGGSVFLEKYSNKNQVVTLFINTKATTLDDKTFRQALNYATQKEIFGERALAPISPNSYYFNPHVKRYDYDLEHARNLLKDIPSEVLNNTNIELSTSPYLLDIADKIAKNWNDLGIKTHTRVTTEIPDDFQTYLAIIDVPSDPDQYPLWHSTQDTSNISNYSRALVDKLLEEGRIEYDTEKRKELYLDFQRFLNEDTPAIFISFPQYYNLNRI